MILSINETAISVPTLDTEVIEIFRIVIGGGRCNNTEDEISYCAL